MSHVTNAAQDEKDASCEVKSEFYTREGLWKLLPDASFIKHQHQQQANTYGSASPNGVTAYGNNVTSTLPTATSCSPNEPVKVALFTYSNETIFGKKSTRHENSLKAQLKRRLICKNCFMKFMSELAQHASVTNRMEDDEANQDDDNEDDDDDDDVICTKFSNDMSKTNVCKYCHEALHLSTQEISSYLNENSTQFDLIAVNCTRDIYFYEFNPDTNVTHDANMDNSARNLIEKKSYKTYVSTCFDINTQASILNTQCLHNESRLADVNKSRTLSTSHLSLITAAGFAKGEIHVFDAFRKETSSFYNSTKLVDKTKVTCIKWLPNNMNLFLVAYLSGNLYLYDVRIANQPNVAPLFTKLCQNEVFSISINTHSSSSTSSSTSSTSSNHSETRFVINMGNQQPTSHQVAKNPVLRLTVGSNASCSFDEANVNPIALNCAVNEFAFSPCGNYLAIVSQDGFLRVFTFVYQNPQQMQIQLRCSMKSYFGGLLCVCWSSDGRYIATGGEDDLITVFSFVEMRVACRGRGHSSWINSCSFDPWTQLNQMTDMKRCSMSKLAKSNRVEVKPTNNGKEQANEARNETTQYKKQRTISTLSDFNSLNVNNTSNEVNVYYRLASCGQDNQICFWDLTEDVLREKVSQHSRLRSATTTTSSNHHHVGQLGSSITSGLGSQSTSATNSSKSSSKLLPQIIIQPSNLEMDRQSSVYPGHVVNSTTSNFVSTAKNLFSSKSDKHTKSSDSQQTTEDTKSFGAFNTATSFFKKHKRNSSLNSSESKAFKLNANKSNQVTLNGFKKTVNVYSTLTSDFPSESGINSISTELNSMNLSNTNQHIQQQQQQQPFNLCPKLDEVPIIEPLICKRISNERLTSLVFRKDGFVVSSQDGLVAIWSRPVLNS